MIPIGILEIGTKLIDKLFASPEEKHKAQFGRLKLQQTGELERTKVEMSAILAEAQSSDPWTSRARPSFLYVMVLMIASAIPFSILRAFNPKTGSLMAEGLGHCLKAIPSDLWMLFGAGYLGYGGMRTFEKMKGVAKSAK